MASQPTEHIAEELLHRAHEPEIADRIFADKVKKIPLLLRPTSPDPSLNARARRQYERHQKEKASRRSKKAKPLSAKQKRALCIYDVSGEQRKYSIYEPLHDMWCDYMREILGLKEGKTYVEPNSAGPMLVTADYHGSLVEVVRSRCPSRIGLRGIVVKDTRYTFEIITKNNVPKTVPKEQTIFRFEVPFGKSESDVQQRKPLMFELHGHQFESRAPDRANKKFKLHIDPHI
ncbi:Putative ribonuclease P protein subunit Rpp29/RNP1 [Septoria linicola]|uniref:Ribonuclease P protein subunit n=1 Tax=Septoria linicola TaxID=215465 RepID=A0A9Q9B7N7_9PEZI|nr:Putative ribonuclease P protein subunit Rpp29/RNP1 [Septoria linicola]